MNLFYYFIQEGQITTVKDRERLDELLIGSAPVTASGRRARAAKVASLGGEVR